MEARAATLFLLLFRLLWMPDGTIASEASAQPTGLLPEVVVTGFSGSLLSPGLDSVAERFHEIPGAVSVFSSDHYERSRGAYLEDFLPCAPGVLIQSSQGSEDTKVSVRGSGAQEDDIIGLAILLDGMPLNQGDGEAFLWDLDLRSVKYAEVYRGADALRYGSLTLGGAINLITMTGHDAPRLETWLTGGSFGLLEAGMLSGWSNGPFDLLLDASSHFLDGFREHSQENSQKVFLSLGYRINQWAENRFYLFWGHLSQNNPSSLTQEEMLSSSKQTDSESIAQNWGTQWDYFRLADRFLVNGNDCQLQVGAYYNHRDELQRREFDTENPVGTTHFYSDDFGGDLGCESTADLLGRRNRLTIGLNLTFEGETDTNYANLDGNIGPLIAADRTFAANIALYFENQHYLTNPFSILAGFQAVYVQRNYRDRLNSSVDVNQSNNETFRGFSPKLGFLRGMWPSIIPGSGTSC
jgi:iron complex outermembrane recepter protein